MILIQLVIVDTSWFISSKEDLQNTRRYGCWVSDDPAFNYIKRLGRDNWIHKLLDKKKPDGRPCILESFFDQSSIDDVARQSTRVFFLSSRLVTDYMLSNIRGSNMDKVIAMSSFSDTSPIQVIYTSKMLGETTRRRLRSKLFRVFEAGLFSQFYEQFLVEFTTVIKGQNFYDNVQSLVDESVKVDNLKLDYFESLLCYLFAFYFIIVFLPFIFRVVLQLLKRLSRRLPRIALNRYTIEFNVKIVLKCPTFRRR